MAQLKQVQAKLAQKNSNHVQRAEVLVQEVEELRKEVIEIKKEGRVNQGKIETSMASVNDLTEKRISEMTAKMAPGDQQADERLVNMSEMIHRRDTDVNKRIVEFMTTAQHVTLGLKTVVATVPSRPSRVSVGLNSANIPSTSAFPTQQSTSRKIAQRQSGIKPDQKNSRSCNHPQRIRRCP